MSTDTEQHSTSVAAHRKIWERKAILRRVYAAFYQRIGSLIDPSLPGRTLEIGSGIGNLKTAFPNSWSTDFFPNPWLDVVCDAYQLPFKDNSVAHIVMVDVFHHLAAPVAFLNEARRILVPNGRLILLEPYISLCSTPVYGLLHPEPIAWRQPINLGSDPPAEREFYAAQGNATRLFFRNDTGSDSIPWKPFHGEAFSAWTYVLSGGFGRAAFYPSAFYPLLDRVDRFLSRWPRLFAARCLLAFKKTA